MTTDTLSRFNVEGILDILSDAVWFPNITADEVELQKQTLEFELENLDYRPDCEPQLTDLVSKSFKFFSPLPSGSNTVQNWPIMSKKFFIKIHYI